MDRRVVKEFPLETGRTLKYIAEEIRKERTGTHAKVIIGMDTTILAWTTFNIERDEDRVRLANSASKAMGELDRQIWPQTDMKHALDVFCATLWDAKVGQIDIGYRGGSRRLEGPSYACKPFVIDGGGTIIYAPPGRGKSFTGMLMSVSMNAGVSTLFHVEQRRCLYVNLERDDESMDDRLARVNASLGLPEDREMAFVHERGKRLHDVVGAIERFIRNENIEVVLLDSISRSGYGDLNDNEPVNRIIDTLNGVCRTWVALAHTPRQDESHVFGSVHFDAGMDVGVMLTTQTAKEGKTIGVGLTVTKANDGIVSGKPVLFALEFDETGLDRFRPATAWEFPQLSGNTEATMERTIDSLLMAVGNLSATDIARETGLRRNKVSSYLSENTLKYRRERSGKSVLYGLQTNVSYGDT